MHMDNYKNSGECVLVLVLQSGIPYVRSTPYRALMTYAVSQRAEVPLLSAR